MKSLFAIMVWPWTAKQPELPVEPETNSARVDGVDLIVAALPDPVLVLDGLGIIIKVNEHAAEMMDMARPGEHISQAIRAPSVLEAIARRETTTVDYEVRGTRAQHFEVYISPIAIAHGESAALLLVLKDLTREQQIERMRSDFVANASHELRTPLASLSGFIETLQGAARNDEKARDTFLNLMRGQAERMKRLIDDLLSLSRIEMNAHLRPSSHIDLGQVARHVCDSMASMAALEKITLTVNIDEPLMAVGEWDELVQVVLNLVENAIKYSDPGKTVEIEGSREGEKVSLTVIDHGRGIAEQHIPRLTERFYRISVQESRSRGGTGLGLAIVKHILMRHRGRLTVTSTPGLGSRFTIELPAP
jgi:two-component system, OmpR family, phosphate regulon sensor histidine kinase PhoR